MISTGREWLHRVETRPSSTPRERQGCADSGRSRRWTATGKFDPKPPLIADGSDVDGFVSFSTIVLQLNL